MMRKRFCAALILLLLTTVLIFPCFAATFDFETEAISPQEQEALWDSLAFQWIEEPAKAVNFRCFAANEKGEYFLGFFGDPVWVLAYDVNGTYLYGFTLNNILSFALAWDSDADALMILQSDQIIWVDQNGNCLDMVSVPYSSEASQYTRTTQETYRAGNITLSAQRKFSNTFTRVVKTLPDGTEVILFDSSGRLLAGWIFGFLFISMCVFALVQSISVQKLHRKASGGVINHDAFMRKYVFSVPMSAKDILKALQTPNVLDTLQYTLDLDRAIIQLFEYPTASFRYHFTIWEDDGYSILRLEQTTLLKSRSNIPLLINPFFRKKLNATPLAFSDYGF